MASGTVDGWIFVWDLGTGEVVHKIKASTHWICQLSFSQEGNYLASSAVNESCVRIWDTKTAEKVEQGDHNFHAVFASVFSPVSSAVASAAMDGSLYIFDMDSRKLLVSIQSRNGGITALAWLPDGKSIAARNVDGSITLWDTTTGVERGTIRNGRHTMLGWGMAFSPDGTLVTDCDPRGLMFWRKASDEDVLRQTSIVLPESRQSSRVQP
jgi:WD40 repeat protein